jgi:hypothetical protein
MPTNAVAGTLLCRSAHVTGKAGDIYLCHPFIVHTATWPHRGSAADDRPDRGHVRDGFAIDASDPSPVAGTIVAGLARASLGGDGQAHTNIPWQASPPCRLTRAHRRPNGRRSTVL